MYYKGGVMSPWMSTKEERIAEQFILQPYGGALYIPGIISGPIPD